MKLTKAAAGSMTVVAATVAVAVVCTARRTQHRDSRASLDSYNINIGDEISDVSRLNFILLCFRPNSVREFDIFVRL